MTWLEKHQKALADLRLAKRMALAVGHAIYNAGNEKISDDLDAIAQLIAESEKSAGDAIGLLLTQGVSAEFPDE